MDNWLAGTALIVFGILASTALFFFTVTRGALIVRALTPGGGGAAAHVYPVYSDMRLIKLVDFQPVISAILLFQYDRLVSRIVEELRTMDLRGHELMITSCAFGNVIPRVVGAALESGARRVRLVDLVENELIHARGKLGPMADKVDFRPADAVSLKDADGCVAANVMFFLLHELPHELKEQALREAARTVAPGGKLLIGEFHRPHGWLLRVLGWFYFKVFEPYGLALWDRHDPVPYLESLGGWSCTRETCCGGNYQVIVATRTG